MYVLTVPGRYISTREHNTDTFAPLWPRNNTDSISDGKHVLLAAVLSTSQDVHMNARDDDSVPDNVKEGW